MLSMKIIDAKGWAAKQTTVSTHVRSPDADGQSTSEGSSTDLHSDQQSVCEIFASTESTRCHSVPTRGSGANGSVPARIRQEQGNCIIEDGMLGELNVDVWRVDVQVVCCLGTPMRVRPLPPGLVCRFESAELAFKASQRFVPRGVMPMFSSFAGTMMFHVEVCANLCFHVAHVFCSSGGISGQPTDVFCVITCVGQI